MSMLRYRFDMVCIGCQKSFTSKDELWTHSVECRQHKQVFCDGFQTCRLFCCQSCNNPQFFTRCTMWRPEFTFLFRKELSSVIHCLLLARKRINLISSLPRDVLYIIISYVAKRCRYLNVYRDNCDLCVNIKYRAPKCYYCSNRCYTITWHVFGVDVTNYNHVRCKCGIDMIVCINCTCRICDRCKKIESYKKLLR